MKQNGKYGKLYLSVAIIAVIAVALALFVIPNARMVSFQKSQATQEHAAALIEDYTARTGETLSQEDVCRDLSYLNRMSYDPYTIVSNEDGVIVYSFKLTEEVSNEVDVKKVGLSTLQFHIKDGEAEDILELKPWGTIEIDGM